MMNSSRLANMYDRLTAKERLPLILAAEKRGDDIERQRLESSAPPRVVCCPDYLFRAQVVHMLTMMYVNEQLDHLAIYWHSNCWLAAQDKDPELWLIIRDINAYRFCCGAEAWRRFCQEQNFDPQQLTAANYRGWFLDHCTERMPNDAPSREELEATLKAHGLDGTVAVTADTLLECWRELIGKFKSEHEIPKGL